MAGRSWSGKALVLLHSASPSLGKRAGALAAENLSEPEARLFAGMGRYDRAHSLLVAGRLADSRTLTRAALLHDCGKLRRELPLWFRNAYTALEIAAPQWLRRRILALDDSLPAGAASERLERLRGRWRRALFTQAHHGEIGAELLEQLGCELEVTYLVRYHQGAVDPENADLRRFTEADSAY